METKIKKKIECTECFGSGWMWDSMYGIEKVPCDKCNSTGYIKINKEKK